MLLKNKIISFVDTKINMMNTLLEKFKAHNISMFRLVLLSILLSSTVAFAQQKDQKMQTYTQTEIDLKLQLQEQKIETLTNYIKEQQSTINEKIAQQNEHLNEVCNNYSDHISLWSAWMTGISLAATIILFGMGFFINWRFKTISEEVNKEIETLKSQMETISRMEKEAKKSVEQIEKDRKVISEIIKNNPPQKVSDKDKKEISEFVDEINKTTTESELTEENWFIKGYNAHIEQQNEDACFYYKKATELNPKYTSAYNNWGLALSYLARIKSDDALYAEAIEKYKKAVELSPNDADLYNNWGIALYDLAKMKSDETLFTEAIEKYKKAVELSPKYANAYYNWGIVLSDLAEIRSDDALYTEAIEKYKKAVELNPNDANTYGNWAGTELTRAKLFKRNINKDHIENLLLRANQIEENSASFNLACLYSTLDDKEKAFEYLEKALSTGDNNTIEETKTDPDFDNIKDDPRFNALLIKYGK